MTHLQKCKSPIAAGPFANHSGNRFDSVGNNNLSKAICTLFAEFALLGYEEKSLGAGAFLVLDFLGDYRVCEDVSDLYALAREAGVVE